MWFVKSFVWKCQLIDFDIQHPNPNSNDSAMPITNE
jgi:hypothetical protein